MSGGWIELKDLYFSIYDSDASRLLKGFECYELAWSLDSRAVVFYMESQKGYAILGCRLIVQRIGGREEGRIFIEKVPINEISVERIFEFYKQAKREVENVKEHQCKVLGLYEIGDIERLNRLSINEKILEALIGKLIVDGGVRIKCSDLSKSISLVAEIVERLKGVLPLGFKFVVSQLPTEADVVIRPEFDGQVDYDVDRNEIRMDGWNVSRKIYGIYKGMRCEYRSKKEMSYDILREAMKRFPEEICALKNKIGKIMILCDDIQTLERLIRCVRDKGIKIRGEVAYTLMDKWAERVYGKNNEVEFFLIDLYEWEKERRELTELLIKKGVFWRDVVKDAISAIYWDRDVNMLREFARKSFKGKEFEGYVRKALEDLKFRGGNLREFLKFILNNEGLIIGSCGEVLVKAIYDMLDEGERGKLGRKYEQELSNLGIKIPKEYERDLSERDLRRIFAFSFAMMIICFAIGVYVGENFQPIMKISNFITPINQTNITQPSLNRTLSPPISPLPSATPAPSPTPIVTVTYYSHAP